MARTATASHFIGVTKKALKALGLRDLRFHDPRHTFDTRVIGKASSLQVEEWIGHADVDTTMQYLHYSPRAEDAASGR